MSINIKVTDERFGAKGDGLTNDRKAIQAAIDYAYSCGGGTVEFDAEKTFFTSGIVIRSGITLLLGDKTVLLQDNDPSGYVKPVGDGYEHYEIMFGHNYSEKIKWSHVWYKNYPFIYAPEGSHDFAIKGNGMLRMAEGDDGNKLIKTCPIGFYRASRFEISDISITNYHGYAMMPFTCDNGLIKNVKISEWSHGNGDGICMMNCRDMRITGCKMFTGDDAVYIFSSYKDPRASEWWSSDEPQASENIEIDHNDLETNHCKAFGMILWGIDCHNLEKIEVRNVYVHDNHFKTMGNWNYNPYTVNTAPHPVTNVRFENNIIDGIEANFFETVVSDMNYYHSMREFHNGEFENGRVFWSMSGEYAGAEKEEKFGYAGDGSAIYQGLYIEAGLPCAFEANVKSEGKGCRMFVRELDSGKLVQALSFENAEWETIVMPFDVPHSGNYHIGIECETGVAKIKSARLLGNHDGAFGYNDVIFDRGKIIYLYK